MLEYPQIINIRTKYPPPPLNNPDDRITIMTILVDRYMTAVFLCSQRSH